MFQGKKVVLGITGGIAAYKAAEIASWLTKNHAEVHVAMTRSATEFITPLTLQSLTGRPVAVDEFATGHGWQVVHISLVENADLLAIIPATANIAAKIANGIADDVLTSAVLAATCPVVLAPAMNVNMYANPVTQHNLQTLAEYGYHMIEPDSGRLACGTEGKGRLPDFETLQAELTALLLPEAPKRDLVGKKIIVTAGPTTEPIDPVRFITNKSSGKMGYAVARAAAARGADVVLVSGKTALPIPAGMGVIQVETAEQMRQVVLAEYDRADAVIMAAAVADYRVEEPSNVKIKKTDESGGLTLKLVKNPDILKELGETKTHQVLVGFAAETHDVADYARKKLEEKHLDMIVANDVTKAGAGFDVDTNIITIYLADGTEIEYQQCAKAEAADLILDAAAAALCKK